MNHKVCPQTPSSKVIHATRPISHISHNNHLSTGKMLQYIGYYTGIKEETLGELEGYMFSFSAPDPPYTLVNLKVVVGR